MKTTGKFRVCNSFAVNEFQVWNQGNYFWSCVPRNFQFYCLYRLKLGERTGVYGNSELRYDLNSGIIQ